MNHGFSYSFPPTIHLLILRGMDPNKILPRFLENFPIPDIIIIQNQLSAFLGPKNPRSAPGAQRLKEVKSEWSCQISRTIPRVDPAGSCFHDEPWIPKNRRTLQWRMMVQDWKKLWNHRQAVSFRKQKQGIFPNKSRWLPPKEVSAIILGKNRLFFRPSSLLIARESNLGFLEAHVIV